MQLQNFAGAWESEEYEAKATAKFKKPALANLQRMLIAQLTTESLVRMRFSGKWFWTLCSFVRGREGDDDLPGSAGVRWQRLGAAGRLEAHSLPERTIHGL